MATPLVPQGTRIFIETVRGAAQAVTAITKASPPVLTYTGTDPANNDYLILTDIYGMTEMNDAVVKVANVNGAGNTFEAKDQDSTLFGTFASGSMRPVTFGAELMIALDFSTSGGENQYATYQFLWDMMERRKFTGKSAVGVDIPCVFDPTDANYKYLSNLARVDSTLAVKFLFKNGVEMLTFGNFGGAGGMPQTGGAKEVMRSTFSINPTSAPWYVLP